MTRPVPHDCPGCAVDLPHDKIACQRCWQRLPPDIREELLWTWRHGQFIEYGKALAEAERWWGANGR